MIDIWLVILHLIGECFPCVAEAEMNQQDNIRVHSYDYYQEAIAWREQQKMPTVGISIDRRTLKHVSVSLKSFPPTGLVCACCKCQSIYLYRWAK